MSTGNSLLADLAACCLLVAAYCCLLLLLQTGYLPWTWGEFSSISQMDLSGNKLGG